MSRWKKYLGWGLLPLGLLLAAQGLWSWRRQAARQRAEASHDPLTLPSRSRQLMALADTLTRPERQVLFRRYDLARLWQMNPQDPDPVQNGFVGPHHQRLEVVFQRVRQLPRQPGSFRVRGLLRYQHRITPLRGRIQLEQVRQYGARDEVNPDLQVYTAVGKFAFWSARTGRKVLQGTAAIDFDTSDKQEYSLYSDNVSMEHATRLFAFEGYYYQDKKRQRVLWAADLMELAEEVVKDFNIGGRALTINPRYARYGWNEYFQHDEWWTAAPVATARP
ncbi:hypothetical protein E5K00_02440 [Hymenobacter aquaticus]|uniref:Uncharacterized protein n=1 Tax=Hymenobacter aquaticus TaxID=1867101 RepID=A0A4Z0Q4P4_9BACT|nr:hypothetical protein [Hymenobacter aquaticus]TGE24093.1 hypothetical protein E5K00_02440 [Hymenobacter aquaticus]